MYIWLQRTFTCNTIILKNIFSFVRIMNVEQRTSCNTKYKKRKKNLFEMIQSLSSSQMTFRISFLVVSKGDNKTRKPFKIVRRIHSVYTRWLNFLFFFPIFFFQFTQKKDFSEACFHNKVSVFFIAWISSNKYPLRFQFNLNPKKWWKLKSEPNKSSPVIIYIFLFALREVACGRASGRLRHFWLEIGGRFFIVFNGSLPCFFTNYWVNEEFSLLRRHQNQDSCKYSQIFWFWVIETSAGKTTKTSKIFTFTDLRKTKKKSK